MNRLVGRARGGHTLIMAPRRVREGHTIMMTSRRAFSSTDNASTLAERLGAFASSVRYEALPPEVLNVSRRCIVDVVGCMLRGAGATDSPAARHVASLTGTGGRVDHAHIVVAFFFKLIVLKKKAKIIKKKNKQKATTRKKGRGYSPATLILCVCWAV